MIQYLLFVLPISIILLSYLLDLSQKTIVILMSIIVFIDLIFAIYCVINYFHEITSAPLYAYVLSNTYLPILALITSIAFLSVCNNIKK